MTYLEEQQQKEAAAVAIAERLVDALDTIGEQWKLSMEGHEVKYPYLVGPNPHEKIGISSEWNHKDRLVFSGVYPRDKTNNGSYVPYGATQPSISVSAARPADKIAGEIARRLLAPYRDLLEKVLVRKQAAEDYEAKRADLRRHLCTLLDLPEPKADNYSNDAGATIRLDGAAQDRFYGDITVSGTDATFKLHNVNARQAAELCALLKKWRGV